MKYKHHGGMGQWHPLEDSEMHCERASADTCEGVGRGSSFLLKNSPGVLWGAALREASGLQKADHVVEGAVQIFADALQSQKGEIFILLQAVQGLMLHNAVSQQLILGDTFFFHS